MKTQLLNVGRMIFQLPFLEKLLRAQSTGKNATSFIGKLVPNNYQYSSGSIRKFNYKGVELELDIHDYVSHYLYFGFKDASHEQLMKEIKTGDIVLDIGTNFGTTILQFAQKIGKQGRCYGFEPDPFNFSVCMKNIQLNDSDRIEVANIGLGDEKGTFTLVVDTESNRGGNRIGIPTSGKETHEVKVDTLDNWAETKGLSTVDFVKIDVEGFEMNVLKGGEKLIDRHHPTFFIELDDTNLKQQSTSSKELITFLEMKDYLIIHAETRAKVTSSDEFKDTHFDIIARHDKN